MRRVTIIGGGLAGLSLGIALRREEAPITVCEAGTYPRHRVCGEFLSGRGLESLKRLGMLDRLRAAGGRAAKTSAFFSGERACGSRSLPEPALCISRHRLDALLAEAFCEAGGDLRPNERWTRGFGAGVVRASGRQARPQVGGYRWYGLKAHARNVALSADLEMHFDGRYYVGLCRLADGCVNVCGLFRRDAGDHVAGGFSQLRGRVGTILDERLREAEWDEQSFCAVAGLPPFPVFSDGCCVGDALTMPAPVTGNGMSMAIESAEIAAEPLAEWARGVRSWDDTVNAIRLQSARRFGKRLRWSRWFHHVLFWSAQPLVLRVALACGWRALFRATR